MAVHVWRKDVVNGVWSLGGPFAVVVVVVVVVVVAAVAAVAVAVVVVVDSSR